MGCLINSEYFIQHNQSCLTFEQISGSQPPTLGSTESALARKYNGKQISETGKVPDQTRLLVLVGLLISELADRIQGVMRRRQEVSA